MKKKRIRAVLVGCGAISEAWLKAIAEIPEIEMVGFVDLEPERARKRAEEYGWTNARAGTDLETILRDAKPDAVFDCTIPSAHKTVTLAALERGCHVLGEKPLSDSMENAREMVEAARAANRTYAIIQNRRYIEPVRRLKAFLDSGRIGRVTTVHSDFFIGAHFGGFRDAMEHVLLLDMAIHTFDAARFLSGADATSVFCTEWNPPGSWYAHGASAVATFRMTDDIVYNYRGSWCSEGCNTSWESEWRIVGEKGSVLWDGADRFKAEVVKATGGFFSEIEEVEIPPLSSSDKVGGHAGVIGEFVRALQSGATPETVCTDNIKSLSMVFGAIDSADRKELVTLM